MNPYCVTFFNEFENEFEILKNSITDAINQANELIKFIEKKIKELYRWLKTYVFESISEEIYFFKELKPNSSKHFEKFWCGSFCSINDFFHNLFLRLDN